MGIGGHLDTSCESFVDVHQDGANPNPVGFELGINGTTAGGFRWNASYAFANVSDHTPLVRNGVASGAIDFEHGTPTHAAILGTGYRLGSWTFDAAGRWQSGYRDYHGGVTGGQPVDISNFVTVNARIGYEVTKNVTLALTAEQALQPRLFETAGLPIERRILLSLGARF